MTFSTIAKDRRLPHLFAVHLLVVLMALRALIPVGFMPDVGAAKSGTFQLVLCTPTGLKAVTVDAKGEPTDPLPKPVGSHELCAFAAPPIPLDGDSIALVVAWRPIVELDQSSTANHRLAVSAHWNGHGARAPPA